MEQIIQYLQKQYNCHTIILYGSYASNNQNSLSDFDVILFTDKEYPRNDKSIIDGIELDAWIYKTEEMKKIEDFLHVYPAVILNDERGLGKEFVRQIEDYYKKPKEVTLEEKQALIAWMKKMLQRIKRNDTEGNFRYHFLLTDSLEIYFLLQNKHYFGPKKALEELKQSDSFTYHLYEKALEIDGSLEHLEQYINHLISLNTK